MLKDMGCDAIRTAHNMPAPELVDFVDEMGFMVMLNPLTNGTCQKPGTDITDSLMNGQKRIW
jgi:beta-galactosidase/beta-glucuronidase